MAILDLEMEERRLVTRILDQAYQDLRQEIYKTDTTGMRADLDRDKEILREVLKKLGVIKKDAA
jgi:hypothetical protein